MGTAKKSAYRRSLRTLTTTLGLALLAAVLLAGTALAAGHEGLGKSCGLGKPTAIAPQGTINTATPTFTWSKVAGADRYELRVYKGWKLLLEKTCITGLSWTSSKALPTNVDLTWEVRAKRAFFSGAWSKSLKFKIMTAPSPAKAITAFSFASPAATGVINESLHTIAVTVPFGTDVSALVASFTTTGASVKVGATTQVSGTTANDFTSPLTYTVTAADATTQAYTVTVTVAPSPAKAITAFSFASPAATGVINESLHTIAVTVPFGTDVSALVASFTTTGASVKVGATTQVSGTTANDFTSPLTYTVTAADATTQAYTVTVTVAPSPAKAITAFSFASPAATGVINESLHTIAVTVPFGTDVSALVASFTTTGASVKVGATTQVSGTTANDFTSPLTYTVTAADATTQAYTVTVTVAPSPAKAITAFSFASPAATGVINESLHTIAVTVPFGTDVSALVASFTTTGASVKVGATTQVSGTTANDFTSPLTYTVTAADATTQAYTVTVTVAPSPAKAITAFSFASPAATGVINESLHTIAVTVPFGTDVSALVASFTTTGASVKVGATTQVSGTTANDFTSPLTYTVTAADATTQAYTVTVTVAPSPAKAITAFSFASPAATGVINESLHTIAVTVPFGTDVSALVASFTTTGASVKVGATTQVSGTTANDFTSPLTYTVTAADATTQAYTVTVTVAPSPAKAITAFSFASPAATGVINESLHTIAVTVPFGTDVSALVASFTTTGASVKVGATTQVSGTTANDFTSPLTYTVTAADATTQAYTVTVTVAAPPIAVGDSYQGGVVAYILQPEDPGYDANVQKGLIATSADQSPPEVGWSNFNGVAGPDPAALAGATGTAIGTGQANTQAIVYQSVGSTLCTSGAAYICYNLEAGGYSDWYLPSKDELEKLYLNRAEIGGFVSNGYWSSSEISASQAWMYFFYDGSWVNADKYNWNGVRAVRSFPASSTKAITAFSFQGLSPAVIATVNEAAHTIALTVPFGIDVSALAPTIAITGTSVSPAGGVAADFSSQLTYTVTAADATTQDYTVTVTVAAPVIGQSYGGGKIAYILEDGDPGYDANVWHGLIAAAADQSTGNSEGWTTDGLWHTEVGTATALGTGQANTTAIVGQVVDGFVCTGGAAYLCDHLVEGGYSDWYLPSKDELNKLYLNHDAIGGFGFAWYYRSSSEVATGPAHYVWIQSCGGLGDVTIDDKANPKAVRAVRSF